MRSAVVLLGHFNVVLDLVVNLSHLDLIVHHIGGKVPVSSHFLHPLCQLVELPERLLSKVIVVQLQRH